MKKIVAMAMVLFLLIGGLAACNGTEAPTPEPGAVPAEETPAADGPEEAEEEEEEPEIERHEPDEALLEELAGRTLDFRSILDTETGAIFTLGDPRSAFEGILGEAEDYDGALRYADGGWLVLGFFSDRIVTFENNGLVVAFLDDAATLIRSTVDRFEMKDTTVSMASSELSETFTSVGRDEDIAAYMRGVNLQGEPDHLAVALQQHMQSDQDLAVHVIRAPDGIVTEIVLMIH